MKKTNSSIQKDVPKNKALRDFLSKKIPTWTFPLSIGIAATLLFLGIFGQGLDGPLFPWIPGDPGDGALNNWLLERNFQLFKGHQGWLSVDTIFKADAFWPEKNTLAWSDNWLILTPFYAILRTITTPGQAFTGLIGLCLTANFLACYRLARHGSYLIVYRLIAAFISSFSLTIFAQLGHAQLVPAFAGVMAIDSLAAFFHNDSDDSNKHEALIYNEDFLKSTAWMLLQLAIGFYQGFFFAIAWASIFLIAVTDKKNQSTLRTHLKSFRLLNAKRLRIAIINALLLLINILIYWQYFIFSREAGPRPWSEVSSMIPKVWSYFYNWISTPGNVSFPAPVQFINQQTYQGPIWEHAMFPGYSFYFLLALSLLLWNKVSHDSQLGLIGKSCLFLMIISIGIGGQDHLITAWKLVYKLPGFSALRAVSRIGMPLVLMATPILSAGLQKLESRLPKKEMMTLLVSITVLYMLGNIVTPRLNNFSAIEYEKHVDEFGSKIEKIIEQRNCSSFFVAASSSSMDDLLKSQILAMWSSLRTKIPTISGYSGHQPSGSWSATMNETTMNLWLIQKGVSVQEVKQACWIDGSDILKS